MHVYIITGISRGLGEALANRLLAPANHIIGIARTENDALSAKAKVSNGTLDFHKYDLRNTAGLEMLVSHIFTSIDCSMTDSITLINNAGILEPIMPVEQADNEALAEHLSINLTAPLLLIAAFVRQTQDLPIPKTVANISSGAGKKPYVGWTAYCTAKAGLDMMTRCIGLEQENQLYPVKMVSIAPGVMDTDMQALIRRTDSAKFPEAERFITLKQTRQLFTPEQSAELIVRLLEEGNFSQGELIDIRNYFSKG